MNLFADYVQPLTNWMQANPSWSLFFTFLISLAESLAIVGSIVPGSVTMTAIGILAGSGIMRIDLTLIAAALGAVAGDSLSYFLGYHYSDRLYGMWPFKKYPALIAYGIKFFEQHGGNSVLIGRFVGPLRSITPLIAGIVKMKQWRFLIANVISAIGWAILYVTPGILIGAAGHELSSESATRLFVLILAALIIAWLISQILKWSLIRIHSFAKNKIERAWDGLQHIPVLQRIYDLLTPTAEHNHYNTGILAFVALFNLILLIALIVAVMIPHIINSINLPIYYLLNSIHTKLLMNIFIVSTQFSSYLTISALFGMYCIWGIYTKNYKSTLAATAIVVLSVTLGLVLEYCIISPVPMSVYTEIVENSFPHRQLLLATSFYVFLLLHYNKQHIFLVYTLRILLLSILGLSGFGALYLGDYWFSDVLCSYLAGSFIAISIFLILRKLNLSKRSTKLSPLVICFIIGLLIALSCISLILNFKTQTSSHLPLDNNVTLHEEKWWNQQTPILPVYRLNRLGNIISLINIQYAGSLNTIKQSFLKKGWKEQSGSFLKNLLKTIDAKQNNVKLPLLAQLYLNKPPKLVMTFKKPNFSTFLVLRIWESNYMLSTRNDQLWVGSVELNVNVDDQSPNQINESNLLTYLLPALNSYKVRRIVLPNSILNKTTDPKIPFILLIKEEKK